MYNFVFHIFGKCFDFNNVTNMLICSFRLNYYYYYYEVVNKVLALSTTLHLKHNKYL